MQGRARAGVPRRWDASCPWRGLHGGQCPTHVSRLPAARAKRGQETVLREEMAECQDGGAGEGQSQVNGSEAPQPLVTPRAGPSCFLGFGELSRAPRGGAQNGAVAAVRPWTLCPLLLVLVGPACPGCPSYDLGAGKTGYVYRGVSVQRGPSSHPCSETFHPGCTTAPGGHSGQDPRGSRSFPGLPGARPARCWSLGLPAPSRAGHTLINHLSWAGRRRAALLAPHCERSPRNWKGWLGALGPLSFRGFAQITGGQWSLQVPESLCDVPEGAANGTSQPRTVASWRAQQPLCHGADRACPCFLPYCHPPSPHMESPSEKPGKVTLSPPKGSWFVCFSRRMKIKKMTEGAEPSQS